MTDILLTGDDTELFARDLPRTNQQIRALHLLERSDYGCSGQRMQLFGTLPFIPHSTLRALDNAGTVERVGADTWRITALGRLALEWLRALEVGG